MLKLFLTFLILLMPTVSESETMEASIGEQNVYISSGTVHGGEIMDGKDVWNIRWGKHETFERIVLDIYESTKGSPAKVSCYFEVEYEQHPSFRLVFTLSGVQNFSASFPKYTGSELISDMYRMPSDDSNVMFAVVLKKPIEYRVFELHNPGMIVVDTRELKIKNQRAGIEEIEQPLVANHQSSGDLPKEVEDGREISKEGSFIDKKLVIDLLPWLIIVDLILVGIAFVVYFLNKRLQNQIDRPHSSRKVNGHKSGEDFSEVEEVINNARDITEHKETEKRLRKTNNQLKAIIEIIPDIVYFKDAQNNNIIVNKAYEELVGEENTEITGHWQKIDKKVMEEGKSIHTEEQIADKEGRKFYFDTIKTPIYDDQKNVIGLVGIARDITEQKKESLRIEREKEILRKLEKAKSSTNLETASFSVLISSIEEPVLFADKQDRVIEVNEHFASILGIEKQNILGRTLFSLYSGETADRLREVLQKFHRSESSCVEVKHSSSNGEVILRMQPVYKKGEYEGVILIVDQPELPETKQSNEVDFLENMYHQIGTPLKMKTDKLDIEITNSDMRTNIKEMAESLVRHVYEEGTHLALDIELKIPDALEKQKSGTDLSERSAQTEKQGMLRQVLLNIVGNAIKFTEEGEATIHMEVLQKDNHQKNKSLQG